MGIEIELGKDKITDDNRYLNISCLCETCADRMTCDFVREVKSFFRDRKYTECIIDSEVTIYACYNYEQEIPVICNGNKVCIYCDLN